MKIVLDEKDEQIIADAICAQSGVAESPQSAYVAIDDIPFDIKFSLIMEGYHETGGFFCTSASCEIYSIVVSPAEKAKIQVNCENISKIVEKCLIS